MVKMAADAAARGLRVLLDHRGRRVPADNILALVALNIRAGDTVTLRFETPDGEWRPELREMAERVERFLARGDQAEEAGGDEVDRIIHTTTVALDRIIENLASGLVVVNARNEIILLNRAAERYLGLQASEVLGRKADEVIPNSRLARVLETGEPELARRQVVNGLTLVTNRSPILVDGQIIGAVAVFQDISELEQLAGELREIRALKGQFALLLDSVAEGICIMDRTGAVTYANAAFRKLFGDPPRWSPNGAIARSIRSGRSILGQAETAPDGATILADVHVQVVDGRVHGVVAICRSADVVRELGRRLEQQEERVSYLEQELVRARPMPPAFSRIIGRSGVLQDALAMAAKAAASSSTILIRGESGTGKELVAEAIHQASPRADGPFVRLNCAAVPPTLVESELFGHEKGSFTGATRRRLGKFELANGGTIFLDEIGALDITLQAKLLRVLQNRELERVGGQETIPVDVRVIAATNANLEEMVKEGRFREDLYYRLNVIGIYLPPLRERRSDIPLLVEHFIGKLADRVGSAVRGIEPEALRLLMAYDWPGNVRQLENVVERALNLCDGTVITPEDLPSYVYQPRRSAALVNPLPSGEVAPLQAYEREIIRLALEQYGSFNAAAKALGVTHRTVALKARRYGLV